MKRLFIFLSIIFSCIAHAGDDPGFWWVYGDGSSLDKHLAYHVEEIAKDHRVRSRFPIDRFMIIGNAVVTQGQYRDTFSCAAWIEIREFATNQNGKSFIALEPAVQGQRARAFITDLPTGGADAVFASCAQRAAQSLRSSF